MSTVAPELPCLAGEPQRLLQLAERSHSPELALVLRGLDPLRGEPIANERDRADWLSTCLMDVYRRSGEADALALLFEMHRAAFLRQIQRMLPAGRRSVDPEDVLQDAFAAFCRYPHQFLADRPAAFRNWGYRILRNAMLRCLHGTRKSLLRPVDVDSLPEQVDDRGVPPEQVVSDREAAPMVDHAYVLLLGLYQHCFEQLVERDRRLLARIEVEGCTYRRIAEEAGVSVGVVKVRVFRCRKRLLARIEAGLHALATGASPAPAPAGRRA